MSPNCSTVQILSKLIPCFRISSQNQTVLVTYYLLIEVNSGGMVSAKIKAPPLSSFSMHSGQIFCGQTYGITHLINNIKDREEFATTMGKRNIFCFHSRQCSFGLLFRNPHHGTIRDHNQKFSLTLVHTGSLLLS